MNKKKIHRISGGHGWLMILVGLFFDFLPFFLIIGAFVYGLSLMNAGGGGNLQSYIDCAPVLDRISQQMPNGKSLPYAAQLSFLVSNPGCWSIIKSFFANSGKIVISGGATLIMAPVLYIIGSYVGLFLAYCVFTVWFFFKGVNIWSLSKSQRILMTGFTMIVEGIPVLNLIPGITFMVWRHVKITQIEDRVRHNEFIEEQVVYMQGGRRVPRLRKAT